MNKTDKCVYGVILVCFKGHGGAFKGINLDFVPPALIRTPARALSVSCIYNVYAIYIFMAVLL